MWGSHPRQGLPNSVLLVSDFPLAPEGQPEGGKVCPSGEALPKPAPAF